MGKGENVGYVTSIFSFSYNVFKRPLIEGRLTHHHTIPTFDTPEKEALRKHGGKRRKSWLPAFSFFSTMFSTLHKTNFKFSVTLILSSANIFDLDKPKILSFGNELKL